MKRLRGQGHNRMINWRTGQRTWNVWHDVLLSDGWATVIVEVRDQVSTSE